MLCENKKDSVSYRFICDGIDEELFTPVYHLVIITLLGCSITRQGLWNLLDCETMKESTLEVLNIGSEIAVCRTTAIARKGNLDCE